VQKINIVIVIVCAALIAIILTIGGFFTGRTSGYNSGIEKSGERTQQLIEELNGYKQREAERNRRARERDQQTGIQLGRLETIGSTATERLNRLTEINNILANYYSSTRSDNTLRDNYDSSDGE